MTRTASAGGVERLAGAVLLPLHADAPVRPVLPPCRCRAPSSLPGPRGGGNDPACQHRGPGFSGVSSTGPNARSTITSCSGTSALWTDSLQVARPSGFHPAQFAIPIGIDLSSDSRMPINPESWVFRPGKPVGGRRQRGSEREAAREDQLAEEASEEATLSTVPTSASSDSSPSSCLPRHCAPLPRRSRRSQEWTGSESGFFGGFFEKTPSRTIHDPPRIAIMLGPAGNRTIGRWRSAVHQSPDRSSGSHHGGPGQQGCEGGPAGWAAKGERGSGGRRTWASDLPRK
jgi:hypothetical protein